MDLYALLGPDAVGINNWSDASANADEYAATVTDLGAVHTPYPDADLTITGPGEESGTFDSFVSLVIDPVAGELGVEDANVRVDYTASPNDNVIIEGVAVNPTSLGWVGLRLRRGEPRQGRSRSKSTAALVRRSPSPGHHRQWRLSDRSRSVHLRRRRQGRVNPALAAFVDFYVNTAIGLVSARVTVRCRTCRWRPRTGHAADDVGRPYDRHAAGLSKFPPSVSRWPRRGGHRLRSLPTMTTLPQMTSYQLFRSVTWPQ